ncbi:MAG: hypothetical protein R3A52_12570 [Polyangiales bacterium]
MSNDPPSVNPGYLAGLIRRALEAAETHADPALRERAASRARRLQSALRALTADGAAVGSRAPLPKTPVWVTLDVATGGFATGALSAGGPARPHEVALRAELSLPGQSDDRAGLNGFFLTDAGLARLRESLASGRFRVDAPEEGALLVVAWLLDHGEVDRALALLDALSPWFGALRFYPRPADAEAPTGDLARVRAVGDTAARLRALKTPDDVVRMNATLGVWGPLEDRFVALALAAVDGEVPRAVLDVDGAPLRNARGGPVVEGGRAFAKVTPAWRGEALALLADFDAALAAHPRCKRATGTKSNLARLAACTRSAVAGVITDRERGEARSTLAVIARKRGVPGEARHAALRATQAAAAARPTHARVASVVAARLEALPPDGGVASVESVTHAVTREESLTSAVPEGAAVPPAVASRVERSLAAPVEELVARGLISSGEVLAVVAPQVTAHAHALAVPDPALRRVFAAVYAAFRRRRSLLLLNLQSQVRLDELPWVAAIERQGAGATEAARAAAQSCARIATLAVRAFPDAILPNKLVRELQSLADAAGLDLPLVEEIAADIFMGTFGAKFVRAAKVAAASLRGTPYASYYGLDLDAVLAMPITALVESKRGRRSARAGVPQPDFAAMCAALAGAPSAWSVSRNGSIIEWEQVLTTHNLAVLFDAFDLRAALADEFEPMARRCFTAVCEAHAAKTSDWRTRLRRRKNAAYAWRQMLFFVSAAGVDLAGFAAWCADELRAHPDARVEVAPYLAGLRLIAAGERFDASGRGAVGGREALRFMGWVARRS